MTHRKARFQSLYFGEMAERYSQRQQWVQGLSPGFATAAFVTLIRVPGRIGEQSQTPESEVRSLSDLEGGGYGGVGDAERICGSFAA